jgi:hypothetical protein
VVARVQKVNSVKQRERSGPDFLFGRDRVPGFDHHTGRSIEAIEAF